MRNRRPITNLTGAGTLARMLVEKLLRDCTELGAIPTINVAGVAEFNRATNSEPPRLGRFGVEDVSPSPESIRTAIGFAGSDAYAELNRETWEQPANYMVDKIVRAIERRGLVGSQTLWFQGMRTGHGKPAYEMLSRLKAHVADQFVVVKSVLPEDADQRPKALIGYDLFRELQEQGTITATLLTDNSAPFAKRFSLRAQDTFELRALASLLAAEAHFPKNRSLAEVSLTMGEHGVFAGSSFCSAPVEPVKDAFGWSLVRAFNKDLPHRGTADVQHLINVARLLITTVLTDPTARAIDEDIDLAKPVYLIFTVPLALADTEHWERFSSKLRHWLALTYPNCVPIFASGQGARDPRYIGSYWLQVSALFPLPPVPRPIREALAGNHARGYAFEPVNRPPVHPQQAAPPLSVHRNGAAAPILDFIPATEVAS